MRDFFELELLSAGQWFLSLAAVAAGLVAASALWRLPFIQHLEDDPANPSDAPATAATAMPAPTHNIAKRVSDFAERIRS